MHAEQPQVFPPATPYQGAPRAHTLQMEVHQSSMRHSPCLVPPPPPPTQYQFHAPEPAAISERLARIATRALPTPPMPPVPSLYLSPTPVHGSQLSGYFQEFKAGGTATVDLPVLSTMAIHRPEAPAPPFLTSRNCYTIDNPPPFGSGAPNFAVDPNSNSDSRYNDHQNAAPAPLVPEHGLTPSPETTFHSSQQQARKERKVLKRMALDELQKYAQLITQLGNKYSTDDVITNETIKGVERAASSVRSAYFEALRLYKGEHPTKPIR